MDTHADNLEQLNVIETLLEVLDEFFVEVKVHAILSVLVVQEFEDEVSEFVP